MMAGEIETRVELGNIDDDFVHLVEMLFSHQLEFEPWPGGPSGYITYFEVQQEPGIDATTFGGPVTTLAGQSQMILHLREKK